MGDLSELMASIAEKGIIEPIIVRQRGTRFQIVAGERRYQAAVQVGLARDPDRHSRGGRRRDHRDRADREHPAEGPDGVRRSRGAALAGDALLATRTRTWRGGWGSRERRSRSRSSLNNMPEEVKNLCRLADIHSKSLLLQIVRQGDPQKMVALDREDCRVTAGPRVRPSARRPRSRKPAGRRPTCSSYKAPTKTFNLSLRFAKARVDRDEVISALGSHHQRAPLAEVGASLTVAPDSI